MNEHSNGWDKLRLNDLGMFLRGKGIAKADLTAEGEPAVLYGHLYTLFDGTINFSAVRVPTEVAANSTPIQYGDILFPTSGEAADEIGKPSVYLSTSRAFAGGDIIIFRPHEVASSHYLMMALRTPEAFKYRFKAAQGQSVVHIYKSNLECHPVLAPPLPEQEKIAAILSTWDRAIELTEKLIAAKQKRKQALMLQLLTGKAGRTVQLSSVVSRVNDPINPDPNSLYREIGIRSHGKGIFHKEPVTGKSLGEKRVYRVHPNCFVFNVVFAWEQAIAKTTAAEEGMIASHRFPMYQPVDDKIDLGFLLYFFKTNRGKHLLGLASPGGAGRNRTLSQSGFLKTKVPLPPITEQRMISTILSTADDELDLLRRQRANFQLQKRGLMQQLLTGKVRVNVTNFQMNER